MENLAMNCYDGIYVDYYVILVLTFFSFNWDWFLKY